ncbi:hypothetical protein [Streptomyces avidinii]
MGHRVRICVPSFVEVRAEFDAAFHQFGRGGPAHGDEVAAHFDPGIEHRGALSFLGEPALRRSSIRAARAVGNSWDPWETVAVSRSTVR